VSEGAVTGAKAPHHQSMTAVLPIMGVVLVAFVVIGLALPVLPLHVHQGLIFKTGRPVPLSCWPCRLSQRPTARAV
jgi:hypothetical protein